MEEYMRILGCCVRDRVTGFTGTATLVSFDLYGCVQVIVSPSGTDKDGKTFSGQWFDHKRLEVTNRTPVMAVPDFARVAGGQDLPSQER